MTTPAPSVIVLGGGCFWCTEAIFQRLPGVLSVTSGYAGGTVARPTYTQVSSGATGHAEVIRVEYDAAQVDLEKILTLFFAVHDPTSLDRQGNDVGPQYRSCIFWTAPTQQATIEQFITRHQGDYPQPIVTEAKPLEAFYPAEDYHQNYFTSNQQQPYCSLVIAPKVAAALRQGLIH